MIIVRYLLEQTCNLIETSWKQQTPSEFTTSHDTGIHLQDAWPLECRCTEVQATLLCQRNVRSCHFHRIEELWRFESRMTVTVIPELVSQLIEDVDIRTTCNRASEGNKSRKSLFWDLYYSEYEDWSLFCGFSVFSVSYGNSKLQHLNQQSISMHFRKNIRLFYFSAKPITTDNQVT